MKKILFTIITLFIGGYIFAQDPFISEFHYFNAGADVNEGVEVSIPAGYACSGTLTVSAYDGNTGAVYSSKNIMFIPNRSTPQYIWISMSLEDGMDGIALSCDGTLLEFLSYEGVFTATDGVADGSVSNDIKIQESSGTTGSQSLQLTDAGWLIADNTRGALNAGLAPLPVELTEFSTRVSDGSVVLEWATASELNNDKFEIEHSTDGDEFFVVGTIKGKGTTTNISTYSFTHITPKIGVNYYRLKQVDFDGAYTYSSIIKTKFEGVSNRVYVQPTVASGNVKLVTEKSFKVTAEVSVLDVRGKAIMTTKLPAGTTILNLEVSALSQGHYFVKIAGVNETFATRFIKK